MARKASLRTRLREELTKQLLPALFQRGFRGPDRIAGNGQSFEYRRDAAEGTHCLTVVLDKWQQPRFRLDLMADPPEGLEALMERGGTVVQGSAGPGRGFDSWFCADRPWWHLLLGKWKSREREIVEAAVAMLDEIERWWPEPKASRHIRVMPHTFKPGSKMENSTP